MRTQLIGILAGLVLSAPAHAGEADLDVGALAGSWRLDLRPTPDAEPYYQEFVVRAAGPDSVTGTYYGAEIESVHVNLDWGAIHFAFVTRDGSGVYHTTGRLDGDTMRGTTHSLGREFLAVWSAERVQEEEGDS